MTSLHVHLHVHLLVRLDWCVVFRAHQTEALGGFALLGDAVAGCVQKRRQRPWCCTSADSSWLLAVLAQEMRNLSTVTSPV